MAINNLCESFNNELDKKISDLRKTKGSLRNKLRDLDNKVNAISDKDDISDIRDKVNEQSRDINNAVNGLMNDITAYTGSCLDGIVNSINDVKNNADSVVGSVLDLLDGDWNNLSTSLGEYNGMIEKLGLKNITKGLNDLFGCLSDNNDCLPTGKLDDIIDELESFESEFGLNMEGGFDIDKYLTNKGLTNNLKNNVIELNESMGDVVNEVKNLANKKDGFKVPSNLI